MPNIFSASKREEMKIATHNFAAQNTHGENTEDITCKYDRRNKVLMCAHVVCSNHKV